jgi:hypothetical protein
VGLETPGNRSDSKESRPRCIRDLPIPKRPVLLEGEASLSTPLTHRFFLRLSLTDTFNSAPQPGVEQNDLTLLSSVVWGF